MKNTYVLGVDFGLLLIVFQHRPKTKQLILDTVVRTNF